jgi:hypothetical protein
MNVLDNKELLDLVLVVGSKGVSGKTGFSSVPRKVTFHLDGMSNSVDIIKPPTQQLVLGQELLAGSIYTWTLEMENLTGDGQVSHVFGVAKSDHPKNCYLGGSGT